MINKSMINKSGKSGKNNKKSGVRLIAAGLILITVFILTDIRVRPMIQKAGGYQCQVTAARIIAQAVYGEVHDYDYNTLVRLSYDEAGNIISIESNMVNINRLKARVTSLINEQISTIGHSDLEIPLGTISGVNMLYGRGMAIPVRLSPKGYAAVNLVSRFTSAGINQTIHQIIMNVAVDISAVIPGYTTSVNVETEYIIAETIIVGFVPESYTHIILGDF